MNSGITAEAESHRNRGWYVLVPVLAVWALLRFVLFQGLEGYDDISYVRYATHLGHPRDVFEVRLFFNLLLAVSIRIFGQNEFAYAVPTLTASLALVVLAWSVTRRFSDDRTAGFAALLVACLGLDVNNSTVPMANVVAAAFAGAGVLYAISPPTRRSVLLTGVFMGLAVNVHMATAFFFGPFLLTYAAFGEPGHRIRRASLMLAACIITFALTEACLGYWLGGSPLIRFRRVEQTHLSVQYYHLSPFLEDGSWNPEWFIWPAKAFLFTKELGLVLLIAAAGAVILRKKLDRRVRFLAVILLFGWSYINFGTQVPHRYQPIGHQPRYWYPLIVPLAAVFAAATAAISHDRLRTFVRVAGLVPLPLLMLLSGAWGQNVEISRELLSFAQQHPQVQFATDVYTWEEIEVLTAFDPPSNICVIAAPEGSAPYDHAESQCGACTDDGRQFVLLVNPLHADRRRAEGFRKIAERCLPQEAISDPQLRPIAVLLPKSVQSHPRWQRRPPAFIARSSGMTAARNETNSQLSGAP